MTASANFGVPMLETERLRLRPFCRTDFDGYAAMCADPEVMRGLAGAPLSRAQSWRHFACIVGHWQLLGYGMWAVEEKETGAFAGRIGFAGPEGWLGFELAWMLARRFWGRGYATEGSRAALTHAFTVLGQDHVISLIPPANHASIRVAERLGQRLEGRIDFMAQELLVYGIRRLARAGDKLVLPQTSSCSSKSSLSAPG